jgi:hypothetical protein
LLPIRTFQRHPVDNLCSTGNRPGVKSLPSAEEKLSALLPARNQRAAQP